jgi:hypothetical protein
VADDVIPTRVFALKDERNHMIYPGQEGELCSLDLELPTAPPPEGPWPAWSAGGRFAVFATGDFSGLAISSTVRLSVFRFGGELLDSDAYEIVASNAAVSFHRFTLNVAVEVPFESGKGIQPHASVAVERIGGGNGSIQNIRITAIQAAELYPTTITEPPPTPTRPPDGSEPEE